MSRPSVPRRSVLRGALGAGALAVGAGPLAACAPGSTGGEPRKLTATSSASAKGEITIWSRSGDLYKVFDAAIDTFRRAHPHVTVHHQAVDIDAKLANTLITGADLPDGSFWDDAKIGGQAEHLYDLTDLIAPYRKDTSPYKLSVNTVDGRIYGVPWDLDPGLLWYREDLLEDAGVDPAGLATYDDLLDAARALKEKNPKAGPIHLEKDPFLGQLWLEMLANQQGTSLADAKGALRLDSKEYRTILSWIRSAVHEKLVTHTEYLKQGDLAALEDGRQALVPWATWWSFAPQQLLKKTRGKWRVTRLPAWTAGGARSGAMGGSSFIIPAKAKNPELAWLLYEFLCFKQPGYSAVYGPGSVYPGGLNTSVPSYTPARKADKPLFKPVDALGGQDLWKVAVDAAATIPAAAPIPAWWGKSVDYLGNNLQRLMEGSMTPDDVIDDSTRKIQRNLVDRA
ncbi:extracellular solute-binding protein [Streptomyces hygroscopicus subsp. hygroscopicus]|uniref:Lactose/L-arabinose transport system substrate-binding protein n=1 Tax=Streptomyces demainii TaxID=588122 RepID=A0ABT9KSD9_9ACTN|nr:MULTISPECIES: extracellular solute-binding protein [Streptomyces]MBW8086495.1 extracellular solute-binding protein [Streptomyces hygroscopicus subsp. hygroscopicus]MDP9611358.1 lactose/L-arabinose transport system substrate-binding protein [Streptomyces demainii]